MNRNYGDNPDVTITAVITNGENGTRPDSDESIGPALGQMIRRMRTRFNLSQTELGACIDVSQPVVSGWERGTYLPRLEQILGLDRVFGFEPGELMVRAGVISRGTVTAPDVELVPLALALGRRLPNGDRIWCVVDKGAPYSDTNAPYYKAGDSIAAIHTHDALHKFPGMVEVLVEDDR